MRQRFAEALAFAEDRCAVAFIDRICTGIDQDGERQNLSLNPTKISGVCGRLMCCLTNEEETYEELNSHLPSIGDYVTTPEKLKGEVQSVNVLRQTVSYCITG